MSSCWKRNYRIAQSETVSSQILTSYLLSVPMLCWWSYITYLIRLEMFKLKTIAWQDYRYGRMKTNWLTNYLWILLLWSYLSAWIWPEAWCIVLNGLGFGRSIIGASALRQRLLVGRVSSGLLHDSEKHPPPLPQNQLMCILLSQWEASPIMCHLWKMQCHS